MGGFMNRKVIISIILVIIWMSIIFIFSNMNNRESNGHSKGIINSIVEKFTGNSNNTILVNKLNKPFRKIMHFSVYLVLSILIIHTLNIYNSNIHHKYIIVIIICFLYSLTDEFHQTFISGRSGEIMDSIIDTVGSIVGVYLYNIIKKNSNNK